MDARKPTDRELGEVGLRRSDFDALNEEAKSYVLDRMRSYERLDKLYQIMEVARAMQKDDGGDIAKVLESEKNQATIVRVVKEYRATPQKTGVAEFYREWTKKG